MEHWLQQDASLLAMTNEVDYDQDGEYKYILIYYFLKIKYIVYFIVYIYFNN